MLTDAAKMDDWLSVSVDDIDILLHHRALYHKIDEACYNSLLATTPDTRSCTDLSTAISHAGDWLSMVPSMALGLNFHSQEFCLSLNYSLGLRIMEGEYGCLFCKGEKVVDPMGDHQVGCGGNRDHVHRHDATRDTLSSAAQSATWPPERKFCR